MDQGGVTKIRTVIIMCRTILVRVVRGEDRELIASKYKNPWINLQWIMQGTREAEILPKSQVFHIDSEIPAL